MLSEQDRSTLLEIARETLLEEIAGGDGPPEREWSEALRRPGSAFVTLYIAGELRGCIGFVQPLYPLWKTVCIATSKAATEDSRFPRVIREELPQASLQISIIGPSRTMRAPEEIRIGQDGIIMECRGRRGLLLPQVAEEWHFDQFRFLEAACRKAGLPQGSWQDADARVELFTTETIGGKHPQEAMP
jgi:AmmeMemoRadiSam system protein A